MLFHGNIIAILCGFCSFMSFIILSDSKSAYLSASECSMPTISMSCPHGRKKELYYYDWNNKACSTFSYKGCGGNGNRFKNKKECEEKCGIHGKPKGKPDETPKG